MTAKPRRFDYSPDEYLAGIAGKLTPDEQGVYWLICTLIYSRGGPIEDDAEWLSRFFARTRARHVRKVVDHLVGLGKISRQYDGSKSLLSQQRAVTELLVTAQRIDTARLAGAKGGRPSKEINGLEKGRVFPWVNPTEKPTTTTTTTTIEKETPLFVPPTSSETSTNTVPSQASGTVVDKAIAPKEEPSPEGNGKAHKGYPEDFEAIWRDYRTIGSPNASKAHAFKAYQKLSAADGDDCWIGVSKYVLWLTEQRKARPDYPAQHLATFINGRGWEPFQEGT